MRDPRGSVVSHHAADMAVVKRWPQRFCEGIRWVDDPGDMAENDVAVGFPFLDGKVLDIDMSRTRGRAAGINHQDGSFVILVEYGRSRLRIVELM